MTTRGFREAEMSEVAALIAEAGERIRRRVAALTSRFPLYPWKLAAQAQ